MPVVTGLYTLPIPMAVFAIFGSSRHLVVGVRQASRADHEMPWTECAIDPQPLSWISRPYHVDPARREAVAIPAGSSDLATVALFTVPDALMTLKFLDADHVPPSPPAAHLVEYGFQVSVGADNADLVVAHLWCERDPPVDC
jgi:hypothetical protein